MKTKTYTRLFETSPETTADDRIVKFTFATDNIALDGHRILKGAWEGDGHDGLKQFRENPVFLWAHDMTRPPIGKVVSIGERAGKLTGSVKFATDEFAEQIYQAFRLGFMRGASVSWYPLAYKKPRESGREIGAIDFEKVRLLEISASPVPADGDALAEARSAGLSFSAVSTWASKAPATARNEAERRGVERFCRALAAPALPVNENAAVAARRAHAAAMRGSFKSLGDWARAVCVASIDHAIDPRLVRAPTGMGEQDPTAGGFTVPTEFVGSLVGSLYSQTQIAPLCSRLPVSDGRARKRPSIDETSRVNGSRYGGVLTFWSTEAQTITAELPRLKLQEFAPHSLLGYCVTSGELFSDAEEMLTDWLTKAFGSELGFVLDRAILGATIGGVRYGTGAGQPLGILNSPALITQAAAVGQSSATIVKENIDAMWSRVPLGCKSNAVWLVNEDASAQFDKSSGASAFTGVYAPPSNGERFARLRGAPVVQIEQAAPLGTPGDIVLADLSQYMTVENWTMAISGDVLFLSDQIVFRFKLRVDGKPLWSSPITPFNATLTRSPFVALAQR